MAGIEATENLDRVVFVQQMPTLLFRNSKRFDNQAHYILGFTATIHRNLMTLLGTVNPPGELHEI
jgi:hypothetical protein